MEPLQLVSNTISLTLQCLVATEVDVSSWTGDADSLLLAARQSLSWCF